MTKVVPIATQDDRLEAANRWIVRIDEGLTVSDEAELKTWLAADARNTKVFLEAAQVWDETGTLSRLADLFPQPVERRNRQLRVRVAVAATVLLAVLASVWIVANPDRGTPDSVPIVAEALQRFETAIGEQSTTALKDGTVVALNTNSAVDVAYATDARVLHLLRGEMHVEVAEDPSRPLSVIVGDRIVQAIGTSFSVEITPDDRIELVVTEGAVVVGVHASNNQIPVRPPRLAPREDNTVAAGEELLMGQANEAVTPVSEEDIEIKLSWREGSLIFKNEPLQDALAEVERYTTVRFVLVDENLKARTVSGRYRSGDVDSLLLALRMNFNIVHEVDADGRVLLSSL